MSSPAFAASGKCSGSEPCVNFYLANVQTGGSCTGSDSSCSNIPAVTNCAGQTVTPASGCAHRGDLWQITYPSSDDKEAVVTTDPGLVLLFVNIKLGNTCVIITFDESGNPSTPTPDPCAEIVVTGTLATGYTVSVDSDGCKGEGISHITLAYCL